MKQDIGPIIGVVFIVLMMFGSAVWFGVRLGEKSRLQRLKDSLMIEDLKLDIQRKKDILRMDSIKSLPKQSERPGSSQRGNHQRPPGES